MHFQILGLFLLLMSGLSFAAGRSPAVEDFVGIEVDQPSTMPQGTESLFNLENDLKHIEAARSSGTIQAPPSGPVYEQESAWSIPAILGICLVLGLPLFSLLLVMHHMRQKASKESASNIEVLEKYRKERELARKRQEEKRKVS